MTPEDIKRQLKIVSNDASRLDENYWPNFYAIRILKWEFNDFHDGANYTVGDYRFWFQLKEGSVKAGYAHKLRGSGLSGGIEHKTCYGRDPFKNITTLQQIDTLFQFMHPEYK